MHNLTAYEQKTLKRAESILARVTKNLDLDTISDYSVVTKLAATKIGTSDREHFAVMFLTTQNTLISYEILFSGDADCASVYPKQVFKRALELGATGIILTHNHPSGTVQPSMADDLITRAIVAGGELLDIRIVDHIIVSGDRHFSYKAADKI